MTDDLRLPFDPRFDVWVNPPDPTVGGPPLHEFAADKDPEEVRLVRLVAQTGGVRGAAHRGAARGRRAGRPWRGADRSVQTAVERAAACGLALPIVLVRFVTTALVNTVPRGLASAMCDAVTRVTIRDDVPMQQLPALLLHELQHCADIHSGGAA